VSIIHDALHKIQQKRSGKSKDINHGGSPLNVQMAIPQSIQITLPQPEPEPAHAALHVPVSALVWSAVRLSYGKARIMLFAAIFFICLIVGYSQYSAYIHRQHVMNNKLRLSGVFVSDKTRVAMINNQSYQVGDRIGDIKVVSIEHESVKLNHEGSDIDLHVSV